MLGDSKVGLSLVGRVTGEERATGGGGLRYEGSLGAAAAVDRDVSKAEIALATEPFLRSEGGSDESTVVLRTGSCGFCEEGAEGVEALSGVEALAEGRGGSFGMLVEGTGRDEDDDAAGEERPWAVPRVGGGGAGPRLEGPALPCPEAI
jgi:hypothetical protein